MNAEWIDSERKKKAGTDTKEKKEPDLPKKEKQYFYVWYLSSRAWYHILLSFFITGSEIILHD